MFARAIAACGAKVAVLDLSKERAEAVAKNIVEEGGEAIAVACNVLEKESVALAKEHVNSIYGPCDILINGAGGNSPKATTDDEFFSTEVLGNAGKKSFFDLDLAGFNFVFGLNLVGTLLPTQAFALDMIGRPGSVILNFPHERVYAAYKNSGLQRRQSCGLQPDAVA